MHEYVFIEVLFLLGFFLVVKIVFNLCNFKICLRFQLQRCWRECGGKELIITFLYKIFEFIPQSYKEPPLKQTSKQYKTKQQQQPPPNWPCRPYCPVTRDRWWLFSRKVGIWEQFEQKEKCRHSKVTLKY